MLDDLKYIAQKDSRGALDIAAETPVQLLHEFDVKLPKDVKVSNIVVAGMGGSALTAFICQTWWGSELQVPFEIVRGYDLPAYVNSNTLVIVSSYSGNTEETVSCFQQAIESGAYIVALSAGGKIKDLSNEAECPFIQLPSGYEPRFTIGYSLKAFAIIFEELKLVNSAVAQLKSASVFLEPFVKMWDKHAPTEENQAKQLAQELMGKSMVIYAGPVLSPAAYKMKANFNESARNVAFWNVIPEMNHQELMGWTSHPVDKPYGVIELLSNLDHERVNKRFSVMNKLLSGRMPKAYEVSAGGRNVIEQNLWMVMFSDYLATYLGILNGVNPNSSEVIEKFKKELG